MAEGDAVIVSVQSLDMTGNNPIDKGLADAGQKRIDWAKPLMPILADAAREISASEILKGRHIGVCLPLDAKIANLALVLADGGAKVSCWAPGHYTDVEVVHALRQKGISVFCATDETSDTPHFENDGDSARALLNSKPDILLDNGAEIIRLAHAEFQDIFARLDGVTESSKTGIDKIRELAKNQQLNTPVINLNDTRLNSIFNNTIGTGQSVVMAMLDLTNLQIAGRRVLVIGYGTVGRGIASHAAALGARVTVAEIDPVKAMQAQYDGYIVKSIADAATQAEVVFTATGCVGTLSADHVAAMPDGVIVCSAGCGQSELPMEHLEQATNKDSVRTHITNYQFSNSKNLLLLAEGHCVNTAAGEGSPIEIVDKLMVLQLTSIMFLLSSEKIQESDIQLMLLACEEKIALAYMGFDHCCTLT